MSEIRVAAEPAELETVVGSCVALCIWDSRAKIGGMAHIVMPERNGDKNPPEGKYADSAVASLVAMMLKKGGELRFFSAAFAGGASMFVRARVPSYAIGTKNAESVRKHLERLRIPITMHDVGGFAGRKVTFRCTDGKLEIKVLNRKSLLTNLNN